MHAVERDLNDVQDGIRYAETLRVEADRLRAERRRLRDEHHRLTEEAMRQDPSAGL